MRTWTTLYHNRGRAQFRATEHLRLERPTSPGWFCLKSDIRPTPLFNSKTTWYDVGVRAPFIARENVRWKLNFPFAMDLYALFRFLSGTCAAVCLQ